MVVKSESKEVEVNVEALGKFIRKLRIQNGMKQCDLAKILGIDSSTISKWENGNFAPDLFRVRELADALGITSDELLSLKVKEKEDVPKVISKKHIMIYVIIVVFLLVVTVHATFFYVKNKDIKEVKETKYYEIVDNSDEFDFTGNIVESDEKIVVSINNMFYVYSKSRIIKEEKVRAVSLLFYIDSNKVYELQLMDENKLLSDVFNFYNLTFEIKNNNYDLNKIAFVISYMDTRGEFVRRHVKFDLKS